MDIDLKIFNILTDEQKKAVETAQTPEELIALAKEAGYELSPDQLEAVAGGGSWCDDCPNYSCDALCPEDCTRYMYCWRTNNRRIAQ